MFRLKHTNRPSLKIKFATFEGESIEEKVRRFTQNNEPISDGATPIFTERKDGVLPEYDIRTDKQEIALEAMDKVARSRMATREMRIGEKTYDTMTPEKQKEFNEKFPGNKHAKAAAEAARQQTGGKTE